MSKKYYWIKLKESFFTDIRIKKLRKMAGGDTFTIILQKIMLLSLNTNGVIIYQGIESTLAKELALVMDEDEDNILITLSYLSQTKIMIEEKDNNFSIPLILELTGSESDWAKKKREYRKRLKEDNVLPLSDKRREEIELEEKEKYSKLNEILLNKQVKKDKAKEIAYETTRQNKEVVTNTLSSSSHNFLSTKNSCTNQEIQV